jgi:hypothetical protein
LVSTDPVGAPGAGPGLNYVRHMAIVVLFVLTGLLLVAEDDLTDGDGCERAAPRAVGGVVPRRVLTRVAREVTEVVGPRVGLPARLENGVVGGPGGANVEAEAPLEGYYIDTAVGPGIGQSLTDGGIRAG